MSLLQYQLEVVKIIPNQEFILKWELRNLGFTAVYTCLIKINCKILEKVLFLNQKNLKKVLKDKKFKKFWGEIHGEKNKRIPKEFQEDVETQPLIANKQFYVMTQFDADKILDPKLDKIIMEHYLAAKPMGDFFYNAIYR